MHDDGHNTNTMNAFKFYEVYDNEQLSIDAIEYTIDSESLNALISEHTLEPFASNANLQGRMFRLAVEYAMTDAICDCIEQFGYEGVQYTFRPADYKRVNDTMTVTRFKVSSDKEIDYSILRDVCSYIDYDAMNADVEKCFIDLMTKEAIALERVNACNEEPQLVSGEDPVVAAEPSTDTIEETEEVEEVSESEVEITDAIDETSADAVEESYDDEEPSTDDNEVADDIAEADDDASDDSELVAEVPVVDDEDSDAVAEVEDDFTEHPIAKKYASNFADVVRIPEVIDAMSNEWMMDGNYAVLKSTMYKDDGYSFTATFRYDTKNKGKNTRTIEHDGNKTTVYDWRTPSKFAWALSTIPEDGGEFTSDVLSKSLTKESCKKHNIRFIATPAAERNANRGNSGRSKQVAVNSNASVAPAIDMRPMGECWVNKDKEFDDSIWYIAEPTKERSMVYIINGNHIDEHEEHYVRGMHEVVNDDGKKETKPGIVDYLTAHDYAVVDDALTWESVMKAGVPVVMAEDTTSVIHNADDTETVIEASPVTATPEVAVVEPTPEVAVVSEPEQEPTHEPTPEPKAEETKPTAKSIVTTASRSADKRKLHKAVPAVLRRLAHGKPVYLVGKSGTGKNVIAEQVASLLGLTLAVVNCLFEKFDVTGFAQPDGKLQETTIYKAIVHGWLLFLDEFDVSNAAAACVLNSLFANGYIDFPVVGRVYAHPNFRVIAAGNTTGRGGDSEYVGRSPIDAATLNRFKLITVDYDRDVELSIAQSRGYGEAEVEFIEDFRQAVSKVDVKHLVSYRQLDDLIDELDDKQPIEQAIMDAVVRDMPMDDLYNVCCELKAGRNKYSATIRRIAQEYSATA